MFRFFSMLVLSLFPYIYHVRCLPASRATRLAVAVKSIDSVSGLDSVAHTYPLFADLPCTNRACKCTGTVTYLIIAEGHVCH